MELLFVFAVIIVLVVAKGLMDRAKKNKEPAPKGTSSSSKTRSTKTELRKERDHYKKVLEQLRANNAPLKDIKAIQSKLHQANRKIAGSAPQQANDKAGYVYVISNIGSFGEGVVKIGMTRRLDPLDRVAELGDASVPFPFDVHTLVFSNDAYALEAKLHRVFAKKRVNKANTRKEFFYVTPREVKSALDKLDGHRVIEHTEDAKAPQWRKSNRGVKRAHNR